jgi:DNA-binding CsgD family transcriptional regulator
MSGQIDEVIDAIYEAGGRPEQWSGVLGQLCSLLGLETATQLIEADGFVHFAWAGFGTWSEPAFRRHEHDFRRWIRNAPVARAFRQEQLAPPREFLGSSFYQEVIRPIGAGAHGLGAVPIRAPGQEVTLFVGTPPNRVVPSGALATFDELVPHLRRAAATTLAIAHGRVLAASASAAFEGTEDVIFVVEASMRPVLLSKAAEGLLAARDGCWRAHNGCVVDPLGTLAPAVAAMLQADSRDLSARTLRLRRPDGRPDWLVRLSRAEGNARIVCLRFEAEKGIDAVARRFRLTAQERRAASLLASGHVGVPVLAQALGVSANTARTHLAHIFSKTGTRRQAELVALLSG